MTAVDRPVSAAPYSALRELVELVAPNLGIVYNGGIDELDSWEDYRECKNGRDLEAPLPRLEHERKRVRCTRIAFAPCDSHPLTWTPVQEQSQYSDIPCASTNRTWQRRSNETLHACEPLAPVSCEQVPGPDLLDGATELKTWQQRDVDVLPTACAPGFPRVRRDFLRIYIAERLMYEHGKIRGLVCTSLLPPRPTASLAPQCTLGVRHSWNKTHRRRQWVQLNTNDSSNDLIYS